jgi:hypothetical protein
MMLNQSQPEKDDNTDENIGVKKARFIEVYTETLCGAFIAAILFVFIRSSIRERHAK